MRKIGTGRRKKNTVNTMEKTKDPSECERNNSMYRSNLNFPSGSNRKTRMKIKQKRTHFRSLFLTKKS